MLLSIKKRVLAVYTDWAQRKTYGGCGYYRVVAPMRHLGVKHIGRIFGGLLPKGMNAADGWTKIFEQYDLLYMMKIDGPEAISQVVVAKNYFKKKLVIDLDDDYFTIDSWSTAKRTVTPDKIDNIKILLEEADALTVSTDHLKQRYLPYNKNIYVIENAIDYNDWQAENQLKDDGKIRIGWQGSSTHERDFTTVMPALKKVLKRNKDVVFRHIGHNSDIFDELPEGQHEFVKPVLEHAEVAPHIAKQGFDLAIAPLFPMKFNRSKSAGKYFEYSALRIPSVVTGGTWSPYYGKFRHGVEGFYASDKKEWIRCIELLIKDARKRKQVGEAAYRNVESNYQIHQHYKEWENMIDKELANGLNRSRINYGDSTDNG